MPHYVLANGIGILDLVSNPKFKLLHYGEDEKNPQLITTHFNLETHSFHDIPEGLFGNEKDFFILLRPDNHISYIGKELSKCIELLNDISTPSRGTA